MKPGSRVGIRGLAKAAHHNGKVGVVSSSKAPEGRVAVVLVDGTVLAVKLTNLQCFDQRVSAVSLSSTGWVDAKKSRLPPTRVRRSFEYDWDNMKSEDWEELEISRPRLEVLTDAYRFRHEGGLLRGPNVMNVDACRNLFNDMKDHREFWLEEIFHPEEADKDPPHVEKAALALFCLSFFYFNREKYEKVLSVVDLLSDVMECFRVLIFENPTFDIAKEHKIRYRSREFDYHLHRFHASSMLGKRDMAVESFRRCTELELAEQVESRHFVKFLSANCSGPGIPHLTPITVATLRNEITDDHLWRVIPSATATSIRRVMSKNNATVTTLCSSCTSSENLHLCSCGTVAYCSVDQQFWHWYWHRKKCKCAVCGSNKKLNLCSGCRQIACCCQEHQSAHWSKHKKDCKRGKQGKLIGKRVVVVGTNETHNELMDR